MHNLLGVAHKIKVHVRWPGFNEDAFDESVLSDLSAE